MLKGMHMISIMFLVLVLVISVVSVLVSAQIDTLEKFNVLIVHGYPFYWSNPEYSSVVTFIKSQFSYQVLDDGRLREVVRNIGAERFLLTNDFRLVVVLSFREFCINVFAELVDVCYHHNISLLFLTQSERENSVLRLCGFQLVLAEPLRNVSTTLIARDSLCSGVWRVGVRKWAATGFFEILDPGVRGVVWADWWGVERPVVVVGVRGGCRFAAVAPYLFAEDAYDNRVLLENLIYWLLTGRVPERSSVLPPEYKSLEDEVVQVRCELENLTRLVELYRSNVSAFLESLPEYRNLVERVKALESEVNATKAANEELKSKVVELEGKVVWAWRVVGLVGAICVVAGFAVGWLAGRRRGGGAKNAR